MRIFSLCLSCFALGMAICNLLWLRITRASNREIERRIRALDRRIDRLIQKDVDQ